MRNEFDRIVIGGGAAGLFAAGWAAKSGLRVLVLEKRERPARKILVTGKGRCNVTNHCSPQEFIAAVRRNPRFLMSAIYAMTPQDTMACFEELGVALKTERGNRVFPVSDRAMDIADALVRFARQGGVQIKQATVSELIQRDDAVVGVKTEAGEEFFAPLTILATGGKSYPGTGSDGSGYTLAAAVGHTIIPPRPSLVPIICENTDKQFTTLMGLSLRNVTLNLIQKKNGKVIYSELGEMLFTHFGISGPLALTASSYMDVPTDYRITIDCKPGLTPEQLDARMLRDFEGSPNRAFGNALEALLPHSLIPVVVAKSGIPAERRVNQLTREERQKLGALIKAFPLTPQALRPIEEAVITAGGVSVKEIDPRTMRSKLVKGLAFAGEPPMEQYMRRPPLPRDAPVLTRGMVRQIGGLCLYMTALCVAFLRLPLFRRLFHWENGLFLSAFFALFVFSGLAAAFCARKEGPDLLSGLLRNRAFLGIIGLAGLVQLALLYFGGVVFRTQPLPLPMLGQILLLSLSVIPADLICKLLRPKSA